MFLPTLSFLLAYPQSQTPAKPLTILLGGDVMLNGISPKSKPLEKLGPLFKPAGAAIVNLEIPLTDTTKSTPYKSSAELRARTQFILKADPNHAPGLAAIGIDLVSLGNNHAMDYRYEGLAQMQALLTKHGILYSGAGAVRKEAMAPVVYTAADGTKIALLSALAFMSEGGLNHCTPARADRPGVGTLSFGGAVDDRAEKSLAAWVGGARKHAQIVVVGLHWGIERQSTPTPYQVSLGRACVDAGADVVWGNHPHVLQGGELYKGKPILYSMGNLISPKGGATGLVKLAYTQGAYSWAQFLPLSISGDRVAPVTGKPGQRGVKEFERLCSLIQKAYPDKESVALLPSKAKGIR